MRKRATAFSLGNKERFAYSVKIAIDWEVEDCEAAHRPPQISLSAALRRRWALGAQVQS